MDVMRCRFERSIQAYDSYIVTFLFIYIYLTITNSAIIINSVESIRKRAAVAFTKIFGSGSGSDSGVGVDASVFGNRPIRRSPPLPKPTSAGSPGKQLYVVPAMNVNVPSEHSHIVPLHIESRRHSRPSEQSSPLNEKNSVVDDG